VSIRVRDSEGRPQGDETTAALDHDRWLSGQLFIAVALVLAAISVPLLLPVKIEARVVLGGLLVVGGLVQSLQASRGRKWGAIALGLGHGLLYLGAGVVLVAYSLPPWVTLVLLLVVLVAAFRTLRKRATVVILHLGLHLAHRSSENGVERLRGVALAAFKTCPPFRHRLARNMKCAGVYHSGLVDLHLERAADQMGFLMHVMRAGFPDSGVW